MPVCPKCKSKNLRESQTKKSFEKHLGILNIDKYRCRNCGWRGYRFMGNKLKMPPLWQIVLIAIVLLTAIYFIRNFIDTD